MGGVAAKISKYIRKLQPFLEKSASFLPGRGSAGRGAGLGRRRRAAWLSQKGCGTFGKKMQGFFQKHAALSGKSGRAFSGRRHGGMQPSQALRGGSACDGLWAGCRAFVFPPGRRGGRCAAGRERALLFRLGHGRQLPVGREAVAVHAVERDEAEQASVRRGLRREVERLAGLGL